MACSPNQNSILGTGHENLIDAKIALREL
jgi:hypothetical protein